MLWRATCGQRAANCPSLLYANFCKRYSTDAPQYRLCLVTMLFHIISDLPGNIVNFKWNIQGSYGVLKSMETIFFGLLVWKKKTIIQT